MTRSELTALLAARSPALKQADAKMSVGLILGAMRDALAAGKRIEIRGFGSFSLSYRPARIARRPWTREPVETPGKHVPHFKTGQGLWKRVNKSRIGITKK